TVKVIGGAAGCPAPRCPPRSCAVTLATATVIAAALTNHPVVCMRTSTAAASLPRQRIVTADRIELHTRDAIAVALERGERVPVSKSLGERIAPDIRQRFGGRIRTSDRQRQRAGSGRHRRDGAASTANAFERAGERREIARVSFVLPRRFPQNSVRNPARDFSGPRGSGGVLQNDDCQFAVGIGLSLRKKSVDAAAVRAPGPP